MLRNFLFILLLCSLRLSGQETTLSVELLDQRSIKADQYWGFDGLGNFFYSENAIVYKDNGLTKVQYQNLPLGPIKSVDLTNPLRPVIFYEQFNTVVILDNYLNEIQTLNFSNIYPPILVQAIGMSNQNRLWVYDGLQQQIGLFGLNTNTFSPIGNPMQGFWNFVQFSFNTLQWIDAQNHWKSATIYGQISDNGPVPKDVMQFMDGKNYFFMESDRLYFKSLESGKTYSVEIVEKSIKKIYCKEQILSIFTDKGITNYKITLP
ncbi:MAG: hypothetical protein RL607_2450 [Bacteroidota bacterium]